ncbi:MAG TPA: hypothetical protein VN845_08540 [Solirubrobacteraceae bacterium]|nr:hypothetical protein [Solirubrobacteraceae bacterium]
MADPLIVPDACKLSTVSFEEMLRALPVVCDMGLAFRCLNAR